MFEELLTKLEALGIGCYIRQKFAAALFYADDMAILAPSLKGLQRLLDCCSEFCIEWDIGLNPKKTKNIYFGKRVATVQKLSLNGMQIDWVNEWVYLGVTVLSNKKFSCSMTE